jgi:hypothetical protein
MKPEMLMSFDPTVTGVENVPDPFEVTYPEEIQKEESEMRKQRERVLLEKQNESVRHSFKQKQFQTKPHLTHRRINMGKR